jgi:broad specificity phosphatase PhoE
MTRVFLIRHGRPAQVWGGASSDPGLSEVGLSQAEAAAARLRVFGNLDIVSSPMRRCVETAGPYADWRDVTPLIEPRVSEIVATEGVEDRAAWLQERFPWRDPSKRVLWSNLEPRLQTWRDEMLGFVRAIREDTAVFTHFIGINVLTGAAMGVDETIVCIPDHASITELEVNDGMLRLIARGADMQVDDVR